MTNRCNFYVSGSRSRVIIGFSDLLLTVVFILFITLLNVNHNIQTNDYNVVDPTPPFLMKHVSRRSIHEELSLAAAAVCRRDLAPVLVPEIFEWRSKDCLEEQYSIQTSTSIILTFSDVRYLKTSLAGIKKTTAVNKLKDFIIIGFGNVTTETLEYLYWYVKTEVPSTEVLLEAERDEISARLKGTEAAKGDVYVFFRAGAVPSQGWLEPLVDIISNKMTRVAVPHYDVISDYQTYTYIREPHGNVPKLSKDLQIQMTSSSSKFSSLEVSALRPEVWAVASRYFWRLGMSDMSFFEEAAYQELSLRIWRCGARIIQTSCSNVAIYNLHEPLAVTDSASKLAEMWLKSGPWDPFEFRDDMPQNMEKYYGKITDMKQKLRQRHVNYGSSMETFVRKFLK